MTQPACGPFTDGYVSGAVQGPLVPEGLVRYRDEACLGPRPRREAVREEIADYVLANLGAPVVRVELDSQQLSIAVDEAVKRYERGAPRSDFEWFYFNTIPGVNRYKLPCDVGIIRDVRFRAYPGCYDGSSAAAIGYDGTVMPFSGATFFGGGTSVIRGHGYQNTAVVPHVNVGEWHLFQAYDELFLRVSSREPAWEMAAENTIVLFPMPSRSNGVAVEYLQRKKNWEEAHSWMKDYALAMAKEMLGRIRSKYDRYVSPSGGTTMDGDKLVQEAREDKKQLEEYLIGLGADHLMPYVG